MVLVHTPNPYPSTQLHTGPSFPPMRETTGWIERAAVILASRQYPQDGRVTRVKQAKTTNHIPFSLDGRGIKGEGEINAPAHVTDCTHTTQSNHPYLDKSRHCRPSFHNHHHLATILVQTKIYRQQPIIEDSYPCIYQTPPQVQSSPAAPTHRDQHLAGSHQAEHRQSQPKTPHTQDQQPHHRDKHQPV